MESWYLWAIFAILFVIVEIYTTGFAVICFAMGATVAGVLSALGFSYLIQIAGFLIATSIFFLLIRPIVLRIFKQSASERGTNTDALIGCDARVTERIDLIDGTGRVKIDGDDWKAVSMDSQIYEVGEIVKVVAIESIVLTVKK